MLAAGAARAGRPRQRTRGRLFFWLQTGGVHRAERVSGVNKADEVMQRRSKSHLHEKKGCGQQNTAALPLAVCFFNGVSVGTRLDAVSSKVNALRCADG